MDITSIIGLLAGIAAMIGGFLWEGGSLSGLLQLNAALIVFGGTLAAVLISFPASRLRSFPAALRLAFGRHPDTTQKKAEELISMAAITRRGVCSHWRRERRSTPIPLPAKGCFLLLTAPILIRSGKFLNWRWTPRN